MNAAPGNDYQRVAQRPPANRTALGLGTWWVSGPWKACSLLLLLEGAPSQHDPSDSLWGWGRVEGGAAAQNCAVGALGVPAHLAV